ncbi:MAG: hypothetical protein ABJN40_01355 [Sneathiella sp.]
MAESDNKQFAQKGDEGRTARVIYILFLASLIVGITAFIGIVMAYINKAGTAGWLKSHYKFQIRTFWIGLLFGILGAATSMFGVGLLILLGLLIWWIIRCVKGLKYLQDNRAIPDPLTWIW